MSKRQENENFTSLLFNDLTQTEDFFVFIAAHGGCNDFCKFEIVPRVFDSAQLSAFRIRRRRFQVRTKRILASEKY
jgi:hypothetical protein